MLHFGTALSSHGPLYGGGDGIGEPDRAGLPIKPAAPQQRQQRLPVNSFQLVFESRISTELVKGLQQPLLRPIFISGSIERQHGQKVSWQPHVMGAPHIVRHIRKQLPLEQQHISAPVSGRYPVFQSGRHLPQLLRPARWHGIRHIP